MSLYSKASQVRQGRAIRAWLPLTALIVAMSAMLSMVPGAEAHAFLVQTAPAAGQRLDTSPQGIEFHFSEPIAGGEEIVVTTADGVPVETGPVQRLRNNSAVRVDILPLDDAVYIVSWQVLAGDGHLSLGEFAFAVGTTAQIPTATESSAGTTAWRQAAASSVAFIGLLLAFGGLASERFVWAPIARQHDVAAPNLPIKSFLALALAGSMAQGILLLLQTGGADWSQHWSSWVFTRPGILLTAQIAFLASGLWVLLGPVARHWALLPLAIALGIPAVQGHAGLSPYWWDVLANIGHLAVIGFWTGALGHLLFVALRLRDGGHDAVLEAGARRYAALALWLVGLGLLTGTIVALGQIRQPIELLTTRYGQLLIGKLLVVLGVLGFAYAARQYALPAVAGLRRHLLLRLVRAESALLIIAVLVAVVLANTAPPRSTVVAATNDLLGPPPLEGPVLRKAALAGSLAVYVAAAEDLLQVRVVAPSEDITSEARISIEGQAPDGSGFDAVARRCGPGCTTTAFPWQAGTTTLTVSTNGIGDWEGGVAEFAIPWPPGPEDPALLDSVIATMRAQPEFTLVERVSSGPGMSAENTFSITGDTFMELELYAAGGATDIRLVPGRDNARTLVFYLPGSSIWYSFAVDAEDRIQREVIVSPGHIIERTFTYTYASPPAE